MNALSLNTNTVTTTVRPNSKVANPTIQVDKPDSPLPSSGIADLNWQTKEISQNVERLKSLTSTILDTSEKYSYDDRLRAYSSLYEMAAKGKLAGMSADDQKLYQTATFESDIGINAAEIQRRAGENHLAARARGENTAIAQLTFFAGLPESDQKTDFFVNQNGFDMAGNRQYADIDAYRNQLVANAVHEYVWADGQSQGQGNGIKGDPAGTAQALKGLDSKDLGSSWSTHILSLLGSDKAATSGWGDMNSSSQFALTPKMPASYKPGNLFTRFG